MSVRIDLAQKSTADREALATVLRPVVLAAGALLLYTSPQPCRGAETRPRLDFCARLPSCPAPHPLAILNLSIFIPTTTPGSSFLILFVCLFVCFS